MTANTPPLVPSSAPLTAAPGPLAFIDDRRLAFVRGLGIGVLRHGLIFLLVAGGATKFAKFEVEAIRPFVEHSPLMSWMYRVMSAAAASAVIGVVEIALGLLILIRRWQPLISGLASVASALMFAVTWSFFFTTPGASAPGSDAGGFLMKDLILLGGALVIAAEALGEARARARRDEVTS